jgi:hypothetical protein
MNINAKVFLKGTVIFLLAVPFLFSQTRVKSEHQMKLNPTSGPINLYGTLKSDSSMPVTKTKTDNKFRMKKSPTVVPGSGQFYNESYWKVPVIWGVIGYCGYEYFRNNNLYKDYRDLYLESQTPEDPDGNSNLKTYREFYRDQRDNFVWGFLVAYTINIIDAYISAHLFDFDVKEEKLTKFGNPTRVYRLQLNLKM